MAKTRFGLRAQLTLLFLVIGLLPLVVATIITSVQAASLLRDGVIAEQQSLLTNIADSMNNFLETTTSDLLWLSESVTLNNLAESIAKRSSLTLQTHRTAVEQDFRTFLARRQLEGDPIYKQIRLLTTNGVEFVRVETLPTGVEIASGFTLNSRSNRDYFIIGRKLPIGEIYTSPVTLSEEFGEIQQPYNPVISYSTPIYYGVTLIGVLVVDVQLEGMLDAVDVVTVNNTTEYFVVDQEGYFLRHPDATQLYGRDLNPDITLTRSHPDLAQRISGAAAGVTDIPQAIAIYRTISLPGTQGITWTLIAVESIQAVLAVVLQQLLIVLGVMAVVSVVVVMIAFFFANSISKPIGHLTQQAKEIASGNYNQQITLVRNDEIGGLAQAFNSMTQQIRDLIGTLEERVHLRTRELEIARRQAESASEAKSIFLSNMSHELRTPLNVVIGYTSSMLDMPSMYGGQRLPEVFREDIKLIQHNGRHLLSLINDVLDLSKIEAGRLELNPEITQLTEIFKGIIATSVGLIGQKPIQITPDYPPTLPQVWADPLRVRQILLNLMSNAIKFTETGSVTLKARHDGDQVLISVVDTGIGIPEDALETLFDRFQQVQKNAKMQGTGLGLEISQRLAQMHGSEIKVQSKPGLGSIFSFALPLVPASAEFVTKPTLRRWGAAAPSQPTPPAANQVVGGQTDSSDPDPLMITLPPAEPSAAALQTILLVEDDSATRALLHRTLDSAGYVVIDVANGEKAIQFATHLLPDLVVLDIQLLDMDGWHIITRLREYPDTRSLPILAIAAHPEPACADGLANLSFVSKPLEPEKLLREVQRYIQQRTINFT